MAAVKRLSVFAVVEGLCGYPLDVTRTKAERKTDADVCCYAVK